MTTWSQIGVHLKPVILLNVNNFYSSLRDFINKCARSSTPPVHVPLDVIRKPPAERFHHLARFRFSATPLESNCLTDCDLLTTVPLPTAPSLPGSSARNRPTSSSLSTVPARLLLLQARRTEPRRPPTISKRRTTRDPHLMISTGVALRFLQSRHGMPRELAGQSRTALSGAMTRRRLREFCDSAPMSTRYTQGSSLRI